MPASRFQYLIPEILGQILYDCLPDSIATFGYITAPLKLGHVCSHWRNVTNSTPSLWTNIHIDTTHDSPFAHTSRSISSNLDATSTSSIVRFFLDRSGQLPLSIAIRCFYIAELPCSTALLLTQVSRWETVRIHTSSHTIVPFIAEFHNKVPLLRSLAVVVQANCDDDDGIHLDFASSPLLSSVCFQRIRYQFTSTNPFIYMQNLELEDNIDRPLIWLQHCQNLEHLTLSYRYFDPQGRFEDGSEESPDQTQYDLPRLSTLDIRCRNSDVDGRLIQGVLDHIRAPALRSLSLDVFSQFNHVLPRPRLFYPHLRAFLLRSSPLLDVLVVKSDGLGLDEDDLLHLLITNPSIGALSLSEEMISDFILETLTYPGMMLPSLDNNAEMVPVPPLCPSLRHIDLEDIGQVSVERIVEMISSRCFVQEAEVDDHDGSGASKDEPEHEPEPEPGVFTQGTDLKALYSRLPLLQLQAVTIVDGHLDVLASLAEHPTIAKCVAAGLDLSLP